MGRVVHVVYAEGSVEKRAGFFRARLHFDRCRGDVPGSAHYLEWDLEGRAFSHEASARMARCGLAFMPDFRWRACPVVVSRDMAGKLSCLIGPFADLRTLFLGLGCSPA